MLSRHPDRLSQNPGVGPGGGVKALQVIQVIWLAGPGLGEVKAEPIYGDQPREGAVRAPDNPQRGGVSLVS